MGEPFGHPSTCLGGDIETLIHLDAYGGPDRPRDDSDEGERAEGAKGESGAAEAKVTGLSARSEHFELRMW